MKYSYITPFEEEVIVTLRVGVYGNGNPAIQLFDTEDGCTYAIATVNTPGLQKDEVAIKDYSENEGMLNFLLTNNIVEQPHRKIESGYVTLPVCKINPSLITRE